jgi:hypothetical protein
MEHTVPVTVRARARLETDLCAIIVHRQDSPAPSACAPSSELYRVNARRAARVKISQRPVQTVLALNGADDALAAKAQGGFGQHVWSATAWS